MSNMSPLAKYGTIAILSVVALLVVWQVWLAVRPSPEAEKIDQGTRELLEKKCKINPNSEACKQLK